VRCPKCDSSYWDKERRVLPQRFEHGGDTYTARQFEVVEYARQHPTASLRDVGKVFGISRQRVFQILDKVNKRKR